MRQVGRLNGPYYARLQRSWKTFRGGISPWPGCRRLRVISMLLLGPAVRGKTVRSKRFERKWKKERKRDRAQLERNRADWHARSTRDLGRSIGFEKKKPPWNSLNAEENSCENWYVFSQKMKHKRRKRKRIILVRFFSLSLSLYKICFSQAKQFSFKSLQIDFEPIRTAYGYFDSE